MNLYKIAVKAVKGLLHVFLFFKIKGKENIPSEDAFILCSNHRSFMDPILLAAGCPRQLTFMAKDELFKIPVLGWLIKKLGAFPIKRGRGDAAAVIAAIKIMKRGEPTLVFPEGTRIKNGERKSVSPGIVRLAMQGNAPIVPAYVTKNTVTYGKPIYYAEFEEQAQNGEFMQNKADELMDNIYSLGRMKEIGGENS